MKTGFKRLALSVAGLCFAGYVSAAPINITVDAAGVLLNGSGVATKIQSGQGNNNPDSNLAFLTAMIGNWNGATDPDIPAALGPALYPPSNDGLGGSSSYSGPAGYLYAVIHYGAGQAGSQGVSPGGWWSAFYLSGEALNIAALPQVNSKNVGGFSSIRYFGTSNKDVAAPGTLALLGICLVGLGVVRRMKAV